ncbi:MAG: transcriptional regulator [Chloroflexi bacterium]|nr:MAG: transcriptional regulator [Chloroflexota bacterium]MBL1195538.1 transcriptional regulator [Chloroflexota bacterium]NOH12820.1 metal-sensitive transcriptional regulator [Chloroflexota bacterium]
MNHADAVQRLKTVEGHIRGIQKMLENEEYCIDVIHQIQAAQSALSKVSNIVLEEHLNSCLITAVRGEDPNERERVLKEVMDVYAEATKN